VNDPLHVANAPSKPVLVYDGDCRFCVLWVQRWRQATGGSVDYLPLQDERVAQLFPELARQRLETAAQFIDADGSVYEAAEAVLRCLATRPCRRWPFRLYQQKLWFARSTEVCYRFVARHRTSFSWLTRILWGKRIEPPDYLLVRRLFLVLLGGIYFIAFVSLWVQITGLIGKDGILPAADLMSQARTAVANDGIGIDRYHILPTLCWWGTSDGFLKFQCAAGTVLALCLVAGVAPPICLTLLWCLYLSLTTVGREFLSFQWDNLLLETGLLAIFLGPLQILPRPSRERPPSLPVLWLLRVLLFKLMFLSGVVKLASGDPAWHSLTALTRHYETQPLPTWVAWHAHQLPLWFQKTSCVLMFVIELTTPFLIFSPRRLRMTGALALAVLQLLILLTGNYTFFNWLTLALCVLLLDDFTLLKLLPRKFTALYSQPLRLESSSVDRWRLMIVAPIAIIFVSISIIQLLLPFGDVPRWTAPVVEVYRWLSPFRSINSYGLFAAMTMERPEILVEGSANGRDWQEYEFLYKPGDVRRRPRFVAPYQPRLDWQMWFAALGNYRQNPWFINFSARLLQGSPEVTALLKTNPFMHEPPRYLRARLYDYRFTTPEERRRTGAWWHRELKGDYLPPISLEMLQPKRYPPAAP
jgi:predicted DCC family thiol-disulfide oxidoreductase YuxK